jgi:hypothetical protein
MKKFIIDMLSSEGNVSSKRVLGAIGFIAAIVFIGIWSHDLINLLLITSASLVGLQTITDIWKPKS